MLFEKDKEITSEDDLWAKTEISEFYAQMEELDKEAILMNDNENKDITETESEKINTISIKSTLNPEKVSQMRGTYDSHFSSCYC